MKQNLIPFAKMHGLGNDFVVINSLTHPLDLKNLSINKLSDRHIGIGFDQLLVIEPSSHADFYCRIFNADGSEAEQCGNGLRCVARYLHESGIHPHASMTIETRAGVFPVQIADYNHIRVTLTAPVIENPLTELSAGASTQLVTIVSTGNPHAILRVENIHTSPAITHQSDIAANEVFPNGANVGFMQVIDSGRAKLRTFERGAGETLACGSNACAASVAGIINGWLKPPVQIEFQCGSLTIEWEGEGKPVHLTGPAALVFTGTFEPIK